MVKKSRKRNQRLRLLHERISAELQVGYPNLHAFIEANRLVVRGTFAVKNNGVELDRYSVEIRVRLRFPEDLPTLRETGGRIPRTADRHINPDGTACLYLEEALQIELEKPIGTFTEFMEGPVRNYFIGQSLVAKGEPWPFGEHEHGAKGILSVYTKLIGTSDPDTVRRYLETLRQSKVRGHLTCPCGSGEKIRDCHLQKLEELRKLIKPAVAARALRQLGFIK